MKDFYLPDPSAVTVYLVSPMLQLWPSEFSFIIQDYGPVIQDHCMQLYCGQVEGVDHWAIDMSALPMPPLNPQHKRKGYYAIQCVPVRTTL